MIVTLNQLLYLHTCTDNWFHSHNLSINANRGIIIITAQIDAYQTGLIELNLNSGAINATPNCKLSTKRKQLLIKFIQELKENEGRQNELF